MRGGLGTVALAVLFLGALGLLAAVVQAAVWWMGASVGVMFVAFVLWYYAP